MKRPARDFQFKIMLTTQERKWLEELAAEEGFSMSDWVRQRLLAARRARQAVQAVA